MGATVFNILSGVLARHTKRVKELMADWTKNTIELGNELKAAREQFPTTKGSGRYAARPGWHDWLKKVEITPRHAAKLIGVADKFGSRRGLPKLSRYVLVELASPGTPDAAIDDIVARVKAGEKITIKRAKKIAASHRPGPKEANRIAKESGKAVAASDGRIYFGGDPAEVQDYKNKRTVIFGVRHAIEQLAAMTITPEQFLSMAMPHQLLHLNENNQIERAADWLKEFTKAWKNR